MPLSSDTATPVVIVSAASPKRLINCVQEFLKEFITDPVTIHFLGAIKLPAHGVATVEFIGFSPEAMAALDEHMDSFCNFFLPYLKDEILVTINPSAAYMVKKL